MRRRIMRLPTLFFAGLFAPAALLTLAQRSTGDVTVDFSDYKSGSGVTIRQDKTRLNIRWPIGDGEHGWLVLQLRNNQPLIEELGIVKAGNDPATILLR